MQIHATVADLVEAEPPWLTTAPDNVGSLLRSASVLVDAEIAGNSPADPSALRDATCAQVASWVTSGIDPASGGLQLEPVLKAKAIGTRRFEFDTNRTASAVTLAKREQIARELCPVAVAILEAADLVGGLAIADGGRGAPEATELPILHNGWL